jgi:hypothetical protein
MDDRMNKTDIARTCHNANKALCEANGDHSQVDYDSAPIWITKSIADGVEFHLTANRTPEEGHGNWIKYKEKNGWTYGKTKDREKKTHPCMVPFDKLPPIEKAKDLLVSAIVQSMKPLLPKD